MINLIESPEKTFTSIPEAQDYLSSRVINQWNCTGDRFSINADEGVFNIRGNSGGTRSFPIRDTGIEGLLNRTGLGNGKFPNDICDNELLEYNINYLFQKMVPNKSFTVLIEDGEFKALMGKDYAFVNHSTVLDILSNLDMDLKVQNLQMSKDIFRASVINPSNLVKFKVDDISAVGSEIVNSENGHASLILFQYLLRYFCTNGCSRIDQNSSRRSKAIHRGNEIFKLIPEFTETVRHTLTHGAQEIEAQFEVLANTEVSEAALSNVSNKVQAVVGKKDTESLMDEWNKSLKIVPCDEKEWQEKDFTKYENNQYDLMQLVTKAAHRDYKGLKQIQLERVGGDMINSHS